jgi:DNA-3-methyladenine glycosylase II
MKDGNTLFLAQEHFMKSDPIMGQLVNIFGDISLRQRVASFGSFIRIVINQQLSNKAANTIYARVIEAFGNDELTPENFLSTPPKDLRKHGLSASKVKFVQNISEKFVERPNYINELKKLDSEAAFIELTKIKGIGDWSANIFLLFYLGDKNIFPFGDSTLIKAIQHLYGTTVNRRKSESNGTIEQWSPYKSIASLYLWEWADGGMPKVPVVIPTNKNMRNG